MRFDYWGLRSIRALVPIPGRRHQAPLRAVCERPPDGRLSQHNPQLAPKGGASADEEGISIRRCRRPPIVNGRYAADVRDYDRVHRNILRYGRHPHQRDHQAVPHRSR
jgi:hypothetical protein